MQSPRLKAFIQEFKGGILMFSESTCTGYKDLGSSSWELKRKDTGSPWDLDGQVGRIL